MRENEGRFEGDREESGRGCNSRENGGLNGKIWGFLFNLYCPPGNDYQISSAGEKGNPVEQFFLLVKYCYIYIPNVV